MKIKPPAPPAPPPLGAGVPGTGGWVGGGPAGRPGVVSWLLRLSLGLVSLGDRGESQIVLVAERSLVEAIACPVVARRPVSPAVRASGPLPDEAFLAASLTPIATLLREVVPSEGALGWLAVEEVEVAELAAEGRAGARSPPARRPLSK